MSNSRFLFSGSGNGERLKFYPNMKAIIAEKPSVGMDIARVVGATEKKYGAEGLPMIPCPFRLAGRQIRTDKGMVPDMAASRQLKVIDGVFSKCDSIIVATDAGRDYPK